MFSLCPLSAPQLDVLDGVLKAVTTPAPTSSEEQPREGEDGQRPAELVEQMDVEERQQSRLPQYLERFQVSRTELSPCQLSLNVLLAVVIDRQSFHASVSHTKGAGRTDIKNYVFIASHRNWS